MNLYSYSRKGKGKGAQYLWTKFLFQKKENLCRLEGGFRDLESSGTG